MATTLNGSLIKALEILELFSPDRPALSAKAVAEHLGMNISTAHRFLMTLADRGFLVCPRRGSFTLGQKFEDLGKLAFDLSPLPAIARPHVENISREFNESTMACRLGKSGPTCIASASSRRAIRVTVEIGTTLPLSRTAQGKLFLAYMPPSKRKAYIAEEIEFVKASIFEDAVESLERTCAEIKSQGYALNLGDNEPEIGAVAVPVLDRKGGIIMTLSMFGILSRFAPDVMASARKHLMHAATEIAAEADMII